MSENGRVIIDAVLEEYKSIRDEILLRVTSQRQVLTWLLTLSAATLGVFITLKPIEETPLFSLLLNVTESNASVVMYISLLVLGGYVAATELLIAFWLFQLYVIFQMSQFIMNRADLLHDEISYCGDIRIFDWETSFGTGIGERSPQSQKKAYITKSMLFLISIFQPLPMFVACTTGLSLYYFILFHELSPKLNLACYVAWFLTLGFLILIFAFLVLHNHQKKIVQQTKQNFDMKKHKKKIACKNDKKEGNVGKQVADIDIDSSQEG